MRLALVSMRGGVGGHFRRERHDRVYPWVYTFDLFQMRGQRFTRRQLLRADQLGHLDCAQKTNRRSGGLRLQSALEEKRTRHSQQDFATGWMILIHPRTITG